MADPREPRHPNSTWLDGVIETRWRQETPYGRRYGQIAAVFLVISVVVSIVITVHQAQAATSAQNRERAYQQQVAAALVGQYGLMATDSSRLPFADDNSRLVNLVTANSASGGTPRLCTVATSGGPDQVTVTCAGRLLSPTPALAP